MGEETGARGGNGKPPRGEGRPGEGRPREGKSGEGRPGEGGRPGGSAPRRKGPQGFRRAGALIGAQTQAAVARRGYAEARLKALWREIVGPEAARLAVPLKLSLARGPAGGRLILAARPACGPQVQMMAQLILDRVNAMLGPGAVGRVQITQAAGFVEPGPALDPPAAEAPPAPELGPMAQTLSSIGDRDLRAALETLARNVLSRRTRP